MTTSTGFQTHTKRILNDLREFYTENAKSDTGIYVVADETNICTVYALIIGPGETPYENGFFYFVLKFPLTYPLDPPEVQLRTTSSGLVRFGPNLYACGKVCLSILGTFSGPKWLPSQTIFSTLMSIRSLMDEHPYFNEPGFEKYRDSKDKKVKKDVSDYDDMITHETLRVAVVGMLEENSIDAFGMPEGLKQKMVVHFKENFQFYKTLIESKLDLDEKPIRDPYKDWHRPKCFTYKGILAKINLLGEKFSQIEDIQNNIYDQILQKALMDDNRDVIRPKSEASEEASEAYFTGDEDDHEMNVDDLYDPESDDESSENHC